MHSTKRGIHTETEARLFFSFFLSFGLPAPTTTPLDQRPMRSSRPPYAPPPLTLRVGCIGINSAASILEVLGPPYLVLWLSRSMQLRWRLANLKLEAVVADLEAASKEGRTTVLGEIGKAQKPKTG
jgi:hypothetical protein